MAWKQNFNFMLILERKNALLSDKHTGIFKNTRKVQRAALSWTLSFSMQFSSVLKSTYITQLCIRTKGNISYIKRSRKRAHPNSRRRPRAFNITRRGKYFMEFNLVPRLSPLGGEGLSEERWGNMGTGLSGVRTDSNCLIRAYNSLHIL